MEKTIIHKIKNALTFFRKYGIFRLINEIRFRVISSYHEHRFAVNTVYFISKKELGFNNEDLSEHVPAPYTAIYSLLNNIPLDFSKSVFLDYGSGTGRAIIVAASFPFKKVIGIELSLNMFEISNDNIHRMHYKKAKEIECINVNAKDYILEDDINIIYFYHPFKGDTLKYVIDNIYHSYLRKPRNMFIIFINNQYFDEIIKHFTWIKKVHQSYYYPGYLYNSYCGIYEIIPTIPDTPKYI